MNRRQFLIVAAAAPVVYLAPKLQELTGSAAKERQKAIYALLENRGVGGITAQDVRDAIMIAAERK